MAHCHGGLCKSLDLTGYKLDIEVDQSQRDSHCPVVFNHWTKKLSLYIFIHYLYSGLLRSLQRETTRDQKLICKVIDDLSHWPPRLILFSSPELNAQICVLFLHQLLSNIDLSPVWHKRFTFESGSLELVGPDRPNHTQTVLRDSSLFKWRAMDIWRYLEIMNVYRKFSEEPLHQKSWNLHEESGETFGIKMGPG